MDRKQYSHDECHCTIPPWNLSVRSSIGNGVTHNLTSSRWRIEHNVHFQERTVHEDSLNKEQILLDQIQVEFSGNLVKNVLNQETTPNSLAESPELVTFCPAVERTMNAMSKSSWTAKLWIQCFEYIKVFKNFTCCERLRMWDGPRIPFQNCLTFCSNTAHSLW